MVATWCPIPDVKIPQTNTSWLEFQPATTANLPTLSDLVRQLHGISIAKYLGWR